MKKTGNMRRGKADGSRRNPPKKTAAPEDSRLKILGKPQSDFRIFTVFSARGRSGRTRSGSLENGIISAVNGPL